MIKLGIPNFTQRIDVAALIPSPGPGIQVAQDCLLYSLMISNPTSQSATVWVADNQFNPIYLLAPDAISPNGWLAFADPHGYLMTGGLQWASSVPGVHLRALYVLSTHDY